MPKAGVVRRDQAEAAAECIDQPGELMRSRREPVQQQDRRRVRRAGLAVEEPVAIDLDGPVGDLGKAVHVGVAVVGQGVKGVE
jgi:hypothetical protein